MTDQAELHRYSGRNLAEALAVAERNLGGAARIVAVEQAPWWRRWLGTADGVTVVVRSPQQEAPPRPAEDAAQVAGFGRLLERLLESRGDGEASPPAVGQDGRLRPSAAYRIAFRGLVAHGVAPALLDQWRRLAVAALGDRPQPAVGLVKGWLTRHLEGVVRIWEPPRTPHGLRLGMVVPAEHAAAWVEAWQRFWFGRGVPVHVRRPGSEARPVRGLVLVAIPPGHRRPTEEVDATFFAAELAEPVSAIHERIQRLGRGPIWVGWLANGTTPSYGTLVELAARCAVANVGLLGYSRGRFGLWRFSAPRLCDRLLAGPERVADMAVAAAAWQLVNRTTAVSERRPA